GFEIRRVHALGGSSPPASAVFRHDLTQRSPASGLLAGLFFFAGSAVRSSTAYASIRAFSRFLRRRAAPIPASPVPISTIVIGSGTTSPPHCPATQVVPCTE